MIVLCSRISIKKETDLAVGGGQRARTRASFCLPHNSGIYTVKKYKEILKKSEVINAELLPHIWLYTVYFSPDAFHISSVRQPLQSATPPHWVTSPMAVRAIPGSTRRRIARRLPNRIQIVFGLAAVFIQLLAWVVKKCIKQLKPENRKRSI